jgi:hypothetical protein
MTARYTRRRDKFAIVLDNIGAALKVPFSNVLGKVQFAAKDGLAKTAFVEFLRHVGQLNVLAAGGDRLEDGVAGHAPHPTVFDVMKVLLDQINKLAGLCKIISSGIY